MAKKPQKTHKHYKQNQLVETYIKDKRFLKIEGRKDLKAHLHLIDRYLLNI